MKEEASFLHCIQRVVEGISAALAPQGFGGPAPRDMTTDRLVTWSRDGRWKTEVVQLSHALRVPQSLSLGLMVYLPSGENGGESLLDGRTLEFIVGRNRAYDIPSFFTRSRCGGFVHTIQSDLSKSLAWFGNFADPASALRRLESGLTNHGERRSRAYEGLAAYLRVKGQG